MTCAIALLANKEFVMIVVMALLPLIFTYDVSFGQEEEEEQDSTTTVPTLSDPTLEIEVVATGIDNPTSMAFLGPDDILVLEKEKGTVQRIVNGETLEQPILDVSVNSKGERGMLGIAVSKNATTDKTFVFLFYTESKDIDRKGGVPIGNNLYRYELVDNKLVNPKLLLSLPVLPGPDHNGGAIAIGPDNNVYVAFGDLTPTNYALGDYKTPSQNYADGKGLDGRAGILRVTQEGKIVDDGKGVLGDEFPLNLYFSYGIRNSFGFDFDPVTGKLWDTENGPSWGDEINMVEPGFNSGWAKAQGIWTVVETVDELGNRHIKKGETQSLVPPDGLNDFHGKGQYGPPKLALSDTIAPTAIAFLGSDKCGTQYENDMFVGTVTGKLLHFNLDENRDRLVLNDNDNDNDNIDNIVLTAEDTERFVLAEGFGIIPDVTAGPDGYLYVVGGTKTTEGTIYRILPSAAT